MLETDKKIIFDSLKSILNGYSSQLIVVTNEDDSYHLDTNFIMPNKKPMFFAATKINKNNVSFHLMPVYVKSELLDQISEPLKKRMQGKSCFNFKTLETNLIDDLKTLTKSGYDSYVEQGYI